MERIIRQGDRVKGKGKRQSGWMTGLKAKKKGTENGGVHVCRSILGIKSTWCTSPIDFKK
jgi:hypothetical protein